jgi:hypothetical protein
LLFSRASFDEIKLYFFFDLQKQPGELPSKFYTENIFFASAVYFSFNCSFIFFLQNILKEAIIIICIRFPLKSLLSQGTKRICQKEHAVPF